MAVGKSFLFALLLGLQARTCLANPSNTIFYFDIKNVEASQITLSIPESARAILALYALQNGVGCAGRNDDGLQCALTTRLGFKAQCDDEHLAMVNKWFPGKLPSLSTRSSAAELDIPRRPGVLDRLCYQQPETASWQNYWTSIKMSRVRNIVTVRSVGEWYSPNGTGTFSYTTRFRLGKESVTLISNTETHRVNNIETQRDE